jgi:uncharacterized membrane protein
MKKIIGFLPILFLIANAILVTICYQDLPDIIPSHFNIKGEVDGYGDKSTIIIPLMIHIGITLDQFSLQSAIPLPIQLFLNSLF